MLTPSVQNAKPKATAYKLADERGLGIAKRHGPMSVQFPGSGPFASPRACNAWPSNTTVAQPLRMKLRMF